MAAATYFDAVQKLYIAFYQRPADPAGLLYWAGQVDAKGGDQTAVVAAFAESTESLALYGSITGANIGTVVDAIYMALFNVAPDAAGKKFYVDGFTAGTFTPGSIALNVLNGAQNADATSVANKVAVANSFTVAVDGRASSDASFGVLPLAATYDSADVTTARNYLKTVTSDAATVKTAAQVKADVEANIANAGDPILTKTFTLTAGVDKFTGVAGNDTFTGAVAALSGDNTLNATDVLDGGAGADTLTATMTANFAGFTTGTGSMKGIETVNLTNAGAVGRTFAAKEVADVATYNLSGAIDLSDLAAANAAINLSGRATAGTTTIAYAAAAVVGTADALTLGVTGLGTVAVAATKVAEESITVTAAGIEELKITATGANVVTLGANDAKSITVSGAGSLKLNAVGTAAKTVDASALTGALDVNLGNAAGVTSVKGGAGNDTIRAVTGDLALNATIAGGAGTNTLKLAENGTVQYQMTGVQTVELGASAGTGLTFSAAKSTGIETIYVTKEAVAEATTFATLGAGALTVNLQATGGLAHTVNADASGAGTVNVQVSATATKDAIESSNDIVSLSKASSLALNVAAFGELTGNVTAAAATSAVITVAGQMTNTVTTAAATSVTLNHTNAATSSTVNLTAVKATNVSVTAKGVVSVAGSDLSAVETMTVANDKAFTGVALAKVNSLTLTGAVSTSAATVGALGSTTLGYGISVTATGQKAGLTIGTVDTAADQTISLNVGGVTGNTTIGTVTVAGAITGTAIVNAKNAGGTLTVGTIGAKTVSVDANGVTGAVALGVITGEAVTVDATSALSTVVVANGITAGADIIAKTSVVYKGGDLTANAVDILAGTGSTGLTVNLTGGILNDVHTVTGITTTTGITVSGDFGIGATNTLVVTSTAALANQTINVSGVVGATTTINAATAGAVKNTITGSAQADAITGGAAADTISGGGGVDNITGAAGADTLTGGAGNDTFVISSKSDSQAGFAAADTSTVNIDKITDFVGNGAAAGDVIQLSSTANAYGTVLTFGAGTTAVVTAITVATAADFTALTAAAQLVTAGTASATGALGAQVYDITVSAGALAGRYLILNDETAAIAATDTIISITGVTGALNAGDFTFV